MVFHFTFNHILPWFRSDLHYKPPVRSPLPYFHRGPDPITESQNNIEPYSRKPAFNSGSNQTTGGYGMAYLHRWIQAPALICRFRLYICCHSSAYKGHRLQEISLLSAGFDNGFVLFNSVNLALYDYA